MSGFLARRREAFGANVELSRRGLALFTGGDASQIDRARGVNAIKPSGAPLAEQEEK